MIPTVFTILLDCKVLEYNQYADFFIMNCQVVVVSGAITVL
jgi:hypothetical protein